MRNVFWGIILVLFGVLLLLDNLGVADFSEVMHDFWPLILVIWGASILLRKNRRIQPEYPPYSVGGTPSTEPSDASGPSAYTGTPGAPPIEGSPFQMEGDLIHQSEVFGDTDIIVKSQSFMGGSVSSVFGDTRVDLSHITIAQGEHHLRIHTVFGDAKVFLPPNAAISVSANSTFGSATVLGQQKGGFSSFLVANTPGYTTADNRLKITISKVFGDLYVA